MGSLRPGEAVSTCMDPAFSTTSLALFSAEELGCHQPEAVHFPSHLAYDLQEHALQVSVRLRRFQQVPWVRGCVAQDPSCLPLLRGCRAAGTLTGRLPSRFRVPQRHDEQAQDTRWPSQTAVSARKVEERPGSGRTQTREPGLVSGDRALRKVSAQSAFCTSAGSLYRHELPHRTLWKGPLTFPSQSPAFHPSGGLGIRFPTRIDTAGVREGRGAGEESRGRPGLGEPAAPSPQSGADAPPPW